MLNLFLLLILLALFSINTDKKISSSSSSSISSDNSYPYVSFAKDITKKATLATIPYDI